MREYEKENLRLENINSKVSIVLVFCGVLFPIILRYLDFRMIMELNKPTIVECNWLICQIIGVLLQLTIVIFFFITILELIDVLRKKEYKTIDIKVPINENIGKDCEDTAGWYFVAEYYDIISKNRDLNNKRYEIYEKALRKLAVVVAIILVVELYRNNLLFLNN